MATGFGFCSNCGTALTEPGQRFCANCGFTLPASIAAAAEVPPATAAPTPAAAAPTPAVGAAPPVPAPWVQPPSPPVAPAPPAWAVPPTAQVPPPPPAGPAGPPPPTWAVAPVVPVAAAPARTRVSPAMLLVGGLVIAGLLAAGYVATNGAKPSSSPGAGRSGGLFGSSAPTATAAPTKANVAAGSVTFKPSSFSCADPSLPITMSVFLPAAVLASEEVTAKLDATNLSAKTVGTDFEKQADGRWLSTGNDTVSTLCDMVGAGDHAFRVLDSKGNLLAQGSFTITAAATPTPAGAGVVTVEPSTFSCTATGLEVTVTVWLPATVSASDQVTGRLDGVDANTDSVGNGFDQQPDGRWQSIATESASSLCGSLASGVHTLSVVDSKGNVLAQGSFTLQP
jgi:hypothetical protein